jgi:hypothetical protein
MSAEWDVWQAEEPSADFAERVAAAMLRERLKGPGGSARKRRTYRLVVVALAACLAAGGAWGFSRLYEGRHPARAEAAATPVAPVSPPVPPSAPAVAVVTAAEETAPPARATKLKRRPEPVGSAPPPKVILPRCTCAPVDGVCGCLE